MKHERGCALVLAFFGGAAIECEHGYDACPICDRCTCKEILAKRQRRKLRLKPTAPTSWRKR